MNGTGGSGRTEARSPAPATLRAFSGTVLGMLFRSAGVVAVLAIPVVTGLGTVDAGPPAVRPEQRESTLWKDAYSERYPGCVPSVLWPLDEKPVALLTRTRDGRIDRVAVDGQQRLLQPVPPGARPIGACR